MPKVGNKHFPYTKAGMAAAKKAAAATGKPLNNTRARASATGMAKRRQRSK